MLQFDRTCYSSATFLLVFILVSIFVSQEVWIYRTLPLKEVFLFHCLIRDIINYTR